LGFTIEPRAEDELPEVVLGTIRMSRIDVTRPAILEAEPDDWVLGKVGESHSELRRAATGTAEDDEEGDEEDG
jgi:hypothetical protein